MLYRVGDSSIAVTESLLGLRKIPKFIVPSYHFDIHCQSEKFAKKRAIFGFWRVKAK